MTTLQQSESKKGKMVETDGNIQTGSQKIECLERLDIDKRPDVPISTAEVRSELEQIESALGQRVKMSKAERLQLRRRYWFCLMCDDAAMEFEDEVECAR